ncbi:MAG: hypothetical protein A2096_09395 [Spirochaetes bacterium GWF1_41_5]|nr:MAG: hypothetical protein A2096_09395 [Spirochaetes bacterium GWF1_41_5]
MPLYILGHELTHAAGVLVFSGKVYKISVHKEFGYTETDTNNLAIRMAPYFFPLWIFILLAVQYSVLIYYYTNRLAPENFCRLCFGISGFLHAHFFYFTVMLLARNPEDTHASGIALSFVFLLNLLLLFTALFLFLSVNASALIKRFML